MNRKKIVGLFILAAGVILFFFSMNAKHKIAAAKKGVGIATDLMPNNAFGNQVGETLKGKASAYDGIVQVIYIGSIALIIIGGGMVLLGRKKN